MATTKRSSKKDLLDGANYWKEGAVPADYMADKETGLRSGEKEKPKGFMTTNLDLSSNSMKHMPLPPRSIWKTGKWKMDKWDPAKVGDEDYRTWIVSGEGTPGNFIERRYIVPEEAAYDQACRHPADWPKSFFPKAAGKTKTGYYGTQSQTTAKATAPALPFGIRFRCPGCGHWYKEDGLAGHAKVCPKDGEQDWAIACECCHSLDDTAKAKAGFPRKVVAKVETAPEVVEQEPGKKPAPKKEVKKDGGGTSAA